MDAAITIPVEIEGLRGVVIYVALCPWGHATGSTFREEETLKAVAKRLSMDGPSEIASQPITDFAWGVRVRNCLTKLEIRTMGQLAGKTASELLAVRNFGRTGLVQVERQLAMVGLSLKEEGGFHGDQRGSDDGVGLG